MVSEVVETPTEVPQADPVPTEAQTEAPEAIAPESAADAPAEAAATELQVEVEAPKPEYLTREDAERLVEERAEKIRADEREAERRRRQTENARRAKQEQDQRESDQEAVDTLKAALGAKGIYEVPDDAALAAINRIASKKAERLATANLDTVDAAWEFIAAPVYGQTVELSDEAEPAARRLAPKIQHLIDTIKPQIEANARKGYIAESELSARVDAEIARRNAKAREGQTELARPEGAPASTVMSWTTYMNLSEAQQLAMPEAERNAIMAADRKARLGG